MRNFTAACIAVACAAFVFSGPSNDAVAQDLQAKFIEKVMEKFDKDGNGQLDAEEMRAAMEYRRRMKEEQDKAADGGGENKSAK